MDIIIIGCGKVGTTLAEQLVKEEHNVVMVDTSQERVQRVSEDIDAIKLVGNGASIAIQKEAGIETADLLIAVTGSDELNLLCCLIARKAGHCHTIARVRNPVYNREINFIKEQLGISMIINPEMAAATEIARILRFPSAIKIDTFAKGRVELLKFKIKPEFHLNGLSVMDVDSQFRCDVLFVGVERGKEVFIPDGQFILKDGDLVTIIAAAKNSAEFFRRIGIQTNQVRNTLIVGGGTIAYYLARMLDAMQIKVKIIEKSKERCEHLVELLENTMIINGDGTDRTLLVEEGLSSAEAFVTLTNMDEENVFLALFAKENSNAKLVTKVNRIAFDELISRMDLGSLIYPKYITADYILQYVRAMQNSIGSNVETLYHILDGGAEALEFIIKEDSEVTNVPLMNINLKKNLLISCINRDGVIHIPRGQDCILKGDTVIVVTSQKGLHDIRDILKK
ncbi:MAG: Trk system potassium transporter TrkA [Otoolea sp.]|nr:Trk system potassium transporter TrkA [Clostridiaceae bacterium]MDD6073435.1 Trk system potassium transporter TrkA [Clostridium sp.]MDY5484209.1 Trk system potassium transporter TrkA [Clostridium sp.]